jgi:hypothetical protein
MSLCVSETTPRKKEKIQIPDFHIVCLFFFLNLNTRPECVKVLFNLLVFKELYDDDLCTSFFRREQMVCLPSETLDCRELLDWGKGRNKQGNQHVL